MDFIRQMTGLISLRVLVAERCSRFFLANCISRLCFKRYCHCFMSVCFNCTCVSIFVYSCVFLFTQFWGLCVILSFLFCVSCLPSFGEIKICIYNKRTLLADKANQRAETATVIVQYENYNKPALHFEWMRSCISAYNVNSFAQKMRINFTETRHNSKIEF